MNEVPSIRELKIVLALKSLFHFIIITSLVSTPACLFLCFLDYFIAIYYHKLNKNLRRHLGRNMPNLEEIMERWKNAAILRARIWTSIIVVLVFLTPTWLYAFGAIRNTIGIYIAGALQGVLWIILIILLINIWKDQNEDLFKV